MKFYVAATLDNRAEAKKIIDLIKARGHSLSVDWTSDSPLEKPYTKAESIAQERAERDIQAVMKSDVFILLSSGEIAHKGIYVELGAALVNSILNEKPQIFVIGEYRDYGMFFFHSNVKRSKTIEAVFTFRPYAP